MVDMKTIEEAALKHQREVDHCRSRFKCIILYVYRAKSSSSNIFQAPISFKAGVEFAQRWIPVEEELPEKHEFVLLKLSENLYEVGFRLDNGDFAFNVKPIAWRPINYK